MDYLNSTDKKGTVKQSLEVDFKKYRISFPGKPRLHTPLLLLILGSFHSRN